MKPMEWSVQGKTALVTGATSGIGKATAAELTRAGATVVIGARNTERARQAQADIRSETGVDVEVVIFDLARLGSVAAAAEELAHRFGRLHVLVNNAGILIGGRRRVTPDGFELSFAVNHLGPFLLTTRLLPLLLADAPARVVNVSSDGYGIARDGLHWDDLQSERAWSGWHAYGASKLCNLHFTTELARRLDGRAVTVNACHPGYVDTQLGRVRDEDRLPRPATRAPAKPSAGGSVPDLSALGTPLTATEGARTPVYLATSDAVASVSGRYFVECAPVEPGAVARDGAAAQRLWDVSERLVAEALAAHS
jgi:NAD(P)-dependent dehydrogenase (short-subunit alcohol dehydrogenase family)